MENNLTDKQRRFCEEYCIDLNATQAAIRAGYSEDSARQIGSENLSKPYISSYINHLQSNLSELTGITAASLLLELKKIAFSSVASLYDRWGKLKDFESLTDEQKAALSEIISKETTFGEDGRTVETKIKLHDKLKAITELNKMLGFNAPEKKEVNVKGNTQADLSKLTDDELRQYIELSAKCRPDESGTSET